MAFFSEISLDARQNELGYADFLIRPDRDFSETERTVEIELRGFLDPDRAFFCTRQKLWSSLEFSRHVRDRAMDFYTELSCLARNDDL